MWEEAKMLRYITLFLFTTILLYPSTSIYEGFITTHLQPNVPYNNNNQVVILEQREKDYSVLVLHMQNSVNRESFGVLAGLYWKERSRVHVGLVSGYDEYKDSLYVMEGLFVGRLMVMCVVGWDIPISEEIAVSVNFFGDGLNIGIKGEM